MSDVTTAEQSTQSDATTAQKPSGDDVAPHVLCNSAGRANVGDGKAAKGAGNRRKENIRPKKRGHDEPQTELIIGDMDGARSKRIRMQTYDVNNAMVTKKREVKGGKQTEVKGLKAKKQK